MNVAHLTDAEALFPCPATLDTLESMKKAIAIATTLANDTMPQEDKSIIDMGVPGIVHVQPQFQAVFQHAPAFFPDGLRLCFTAFDYEDKVIRI